VESLIQVYDHNTGNEIWTTQHEMYGKIRQSKSLKTHPKTEQAIDPLGLAPKTEDCPKPTNSTPPIATILIAIHA
jgi:hypothetical protein